MYVESIRMTMVNCNLKRKQQQLIIVLQQSIEILTVCFLLKIFVSKNTVLTNLVRFGLIELITGIMDLLSKWFKQTLSLITLLAIWRCILMSKWSKFGGPSF